LPNLHCLSAFGLALFGPPHPLVRVTQIPVAGSLKILVLPVVGVVLGQDHKDISRRLEHDYRILGPIGVPV